MNDLTDLIRITAKYWGITETAVRTPIKGPSKAARARRCVAYIAFLRGKSLDQIMTELGYSTTLTVKDVVERTRDYMRSDKGFAQKVDAILKEWRPKA